MILAPFGSSPSKSEPLVDLDGVGRRVDGDRRDFGISSPADRKGSAQKLASDALALKLGVNEE